MFALIFWPHVAIFCIFWLHECLKWRLEFNSKSLFYANLGKLSRYDRLNSAITNFSRYTCLLTSSDHDIIPMAQGRSQPRSPGWARVPLSSFFLKFWSIFLIFPQTLLIFPPHFGSPGGRVARPGRPWLRHCDGLWHPCMFGLNFFLNRFVMLRL